MKKFVVMAILAISFIFSENVTFAEKIYVTDYGSHSIYIETDSIKVRDENSIVVDSYDENENYDGYHMFVWMENYDDFAWTWVRPPVNGLARKGAGSFVSKSETAKAILEAIIPYLQN